MSYNLFLDDLRNPQDVKWIELPLVHWTVVRTYKQFIDCIIQNGLPHIISFDHDLADEHYKEYMSSNDPKIIGKRHIRYETFKEKTGHDCAKWLAQFCVDKQLPLPLYYIHSLNGIGGANIFSVMESARKIIDGT